MDNQKVGISNAMMEQAKATASTGRIDNPENLQEHHSQLLQRDHGIIHSTQLDVIDIGSSGYLWKGTFAYKQHGLQREFDLQKAAGDCSVKPYFGVQQRTNGQDAMNGIIMELGTPFDFKSVPASERTAVKEELVALVSRLHSRGVIHGDINSTNFVRCRDGVLRLCDFGSARWNGEDDSEWEGELSDRYLAPNRGYPDEVRPPQVLDDMYALAIFIWELFTAKNAFMDDAEEDMEEVLKDCRTVDITLVEDEDVRRWIHDVLVAGGATLAG